MNPARARTRQVDVMCQEASDKGLDHERLRYTFYSIRRRRYLLSQTHKVGPKIAPFRVERRELTGFTSPLLRTTNMTKPPGC
jgi:hypothetical protein